MNQSDVIIIGAGATGLMAAYTLVKAGKSVTVLEARSRIGGRIHTSTNKGFSGPVELGAEFVHGNLPVTLGLLKEAGLATHGVDFEMWQYHNGSFSQSDEFIDGFGGFLKKLNALQHDMPLYDFLEQNFAGPQHATMRIQIENYVSGYDTADVHEASAFALRNEWNHEDEDAQHRVNGGYCTLLNYLAAAIQEGGSEILLNSAVADVFWESGAVKAITTGGTIYEAAKAVIALPLGVLQAPKDSEGALQFQPTLKEQAEAIYNIGFGSVIKILLEFDGIFWEGDAVTKRVGADLSTMGFLFSDEGIPTFWTQAPTHSPLLTGWLGGPPAYQKKHMPDEAILELTLASLGNIFNISPEVLKKKLVAWQVANWTAEPYTRGSYAYDKVKSPDARRVLLQPVEHTLYFAGEYLYDGPAMGTVEAALTSGKNAAAMVLKG